MYSGQSCLVRVRVYLEEAIQRLAWTKWTTVACKRCLGTISTVCCSAVLRTDHVNGYTGMCLLRTFPKDPWKIPINLFRNWQLESGSMIAFGVTYKYTLFLTLFKAVCIAMFCFMIDRMKTLPDVSYRKHLFQVYESNPKKTNNILFYYMANDTWNIRISFFSLLFKDNIITTNYVAIIH